MDDADPNLFAPLAGESPAIAAIRAQLAYAAVAAAPVMLIGERGTGKHLAASLLAGGRTTAEVAPHQLTPDSLPHWFSPPAGPEVLILRDPAGLTPEVQQRLHRLLADPASFGLPRLPRLITLSRTDPLGDLPDSPPHHPPLRADLFYRLSAVLIRLPPLRHRPGDVERLLRDRLGEDLTIDRPAARRLSAHAWPGNVRELLALADAIAPQLPRSNPTLTEAHLPPELGATALLGTSLPMRPPSSDDAQTAIVRTRFAETEVAAADQPLAAATLTPFSDAIIPLAELERRAVEHALRLCDGDVGLAARRLGLSEAALRQRLRRAEP